MTFRWLAKASKSASGTTMLVMCLIFTAGERIAIAVDDAKPVSSWTPFSSCKERVDLPPRYGPRHLVATAYVIDCMPMERWVFIHMHADGTPDRVGNAIFLYSGTDPTMEWVGLDGLRIAVGSVGRATTQVVRLDGIAIQYSLSPEVRH